MSAPLDLIRRMNLTRRTLAKLGDTLGIKKKVARLAALDAKREELAAEIKAIVKATKVAKPRAKKLKPRSAEGKVLNWPKSIS